MKKSKLFLFAALSLALSVNAVASSIVTPAFVSRAAAGAVARSQSDKQSDVVNLKDFGVKADGTTDDTSAITQFFTNNPSYRGVVVVPYGTKFNKASVFAAAPSGVILRDESSINTGQPPGYKNKSVVFYSNDTVSDDTYFGVSSSHHPAIRLNNLHTAGTSSATSAYHSIMFSYGYRWNNDLIDGMQYLTSQSARGSLWRSSWVLNTPFDYAKNGAAQWTASTAYAINAMVNTSDGNEYKATVAGTSGAAKPTHTSGTATDGTVTWQYMGPWSAGQTLFYFDEDGYGAISGPSSGRWAAESATKKGLSINVNDASGDTYLRDDQRGVDLLRLSSASGLQTSALASLNYGGAISGVTPTISTNFHSVNNGSATNMTDLVMSGVRWTASTAYALNAIVNTTDSNMYKATVAGTSGATKPTHTSGTATDGTVIWQYLGPAQVRAGPECLYFSTANTTVMNTGGNFNLKGAVNVTPAAGAIMCFIKEPALSGGWLEMSRNF